jgi:hypothetical protein
MKQGSVLEAGPAALWTIGTADGLGASSTPAEERIGRYISHRRGEYYLASKCGCLKDKHCYLSSQTSSIRQPLNRPLTMIVNPFTHGCQQVESRV